MKTRIDFVSNSSSSSFILQDVGFFKHFGITANDIYNAIVELYYGLKENYDNLLEKEIKHCDDEISKARQDNIDDDASYYAKCKNDILKNGLGAFEMFNMTDPKECDECYKKWDEHFEQWVAPNEGNVEEWNNFEHMARFDCDFDNVMEVINGKDAELKTINYDRKNDKHTETLFAGGAAFIRHVKDKLDIKTMKEVLHDKNTTLMVHFADNEVYALNRMCDDGKEDEADYKSKESNEKCRVSKWDSRSYSKERFFEILIKYFIDKSKINLADPELLEYWRVPEDHWWKTEPHSKYKDKKYFTDSDKTATWKEVVDDMLNENSIMHEG